MRFKQLLTYVVFGTGVASRVLAQSATPSPGPSANPDWSLPKQDTAPKVDAKTSTAPSQIPCGIAAGRWMESVLKGFSGDQMKHLTAVMVNEYGDPCGFYGNRDFAVAGDPIFAAVYTTPNTVGASVGLAACAAEAALSLQSSGDLFQPQAKKPGEPWQDAPRRVCHGGGAVEIVSTTVTQEDGKLGSPAVKKTAINQYARYRATLQLGAIYTDRHEATFGLRKDGEQNRIVTQTPIERGPEYVGILNIYAVPRYFQRPPWGGLYKGRDIVHDHGVADRIGLVFGAGLSKPSRRFMAGASLELLPGISVLGVHEWAQVKELVGVQDGGPFTEAAEKIPTRDEWSRGWVFGASFDLLYAAKLFGKKP